MRRALLLVALLPTLGCASGMSLIRTAMSKMVPDTDGVLTVFTRFGIAHACPVGDGSIALTAAHVVDEQPFRPDLGLYPARWSNAAGQSGIFYPVAASRAVDLASVRPSEGLFPNPYQLAKAPPEAGTLVYIVGYDYKDRDHALARKITLARVLRRQADALILDQDSKHGSSGSCVLNPQSEVVGILIWGPTMENGDTVTVAAGVWDGLADVRQLKEANAK